MSAVLHPNRDKQRWPAAILRPAEQSIVRRDARTEDAGHRLQLAWREARILRSARK